MSGLVKDIDDGSGSSLSLLSAGLAGSSDGPGPSTDAAAAAFARSSASLFSAVFRYALAVVLTALLGLQRSGLRGE